MGDSMYEDVKPATTAHECLTRAGKALARAEERGRLRVNPTAELAIAGRYMQLAKAIDTKKEQ
jgi:hypothetical protein